MKITKTLRYLFFIGVISTPITPTIALASTKVPMTEARQKQQITSIAEQVSDRISQSGPNTPVPELAPLINEVWNSIVRNQDIKAKVKTDPAIRALYIQTVNHLKHVSLSFEIESNSYVHDYVLKGPYPYQPTLNALQKARDFLKIVDSSLPKSITSHPRNTERERLLLDEQKELVKKITANSATVYEQMISRLRADGPNV